MKEEKQVKRKNNELNEKIDDIKEILDDKTENLKNDLTKKAKELKEDIEEKSEDIKEKSKEIVEDIKDKTEEILKNIKGNSKKFDKKDIEENKAMACLAYIIAPVPYFTEDKSKWVRYHSIQGMNFFIIFVISCLLVSIINSLILFPFPFLKGVLRTILYTFGIIYALIGIINVCNGEAKELPIINKFKFIKK